MEQSSAHGLFHIILVDEDEGKGDDDCQNQHRFHVPEQLVVAKEGAETAFEGKHVEGEADSGDKHEDRDDVLDKRRVPVGNAGLLRGKAARGGGGDGVAHGIERFHAAHPQQHAFDAGDDDVERADVACHNCDFRVDFDVLHASGFGHEEQLPATAEDGQQRHTEEHDAEAANPLREAAPEEQAVGQGFDVVENACARGGKARHGFKEGVGHAGDIVAQAKGQHAEQREEYPRDAHNEVRVAPPHHLHSLSSIEHQPQAAGHSNQYGV